MAEESIPVPKFVLGQELERVRLEAGVELEEAAERLGRIPLTVRRFELGKTLIDQLQLEALISLYGVGPDTEQHLKNLHRTASEPEWWTAKYGARPGAQALMLAMEMTAGAMWSWDHSLIPGLLQTPAYARTVIKESDLDSTPESLQRGVALRMDRQSQVWNGVRSPEATFLVHEAALLQISGTPQTRRAQLAKLLALPESATLQIVPFKAGPHAALGSFVIFEFNSPNIPQAAFAEGSITAKHTVEYGEAVTRYKLVFERVRAKALDPDKSARYIEEMMEGIKE